MLRFLAGFVVACVGFLACVSVGVVSIETELDVSISRTFAADFLDSNEIASPFLSQSQNASTCGPGAYCVAPFMTNSSSLLPCPLGFACPGNETGRYCPAGFYCPTPSKIIPCPADHFCPPGRVKPLACPWGSLCPEQSSRYVFLGGIILLCSIIPILLALEKCSALCAFTRRVGGFEPKKKISPGVAMLVDLYRKQLAKMQTENGKSGEPSLIPTRLQSNVVNPSALSRQDSARISLFSSSHSDSRDDIKHNGLAEPRGSNSDIWKETKEFDQKLMLPVSAVSSNELGRRINYNGTTQGDSPEESRQADRSHSDEVKEPSSGNGSGNGSGSGSRSPAGGGSGLITTSASGWSEIGMGALERVQPRRESFILHQAEAERGNPAGSDSPPNPVGGSGSASPLIPVAESAHGDHVLLSPRNAHNQDPLAPTVFSAKPFLKALQPLFEISKRQLTFSFDFSASLRSVALLPEEIAAALFHEQLNVSFENLHAQINVAGARRTIVENVTGHFRCGRVCAIMGPSGSGKSSLLSLLTGKLHKSSGRIIINGREDEISNHRRAVGFVPQDDIMLPLLTVEDVLTHSAALRTPTTLSAAQRRVIVDKVLEILNLTHVRHNVIGDENTRGLSGGEKKRVNIGLELVSNPSMLLLDECTTGLDSSQSMAVMRVLRAVAQKQVTIVAVLHQPRPEIVNMLDDLLLLAPGGRTVFFGPASEAPDYFDSLGFPCPVGTSPADWYLDVLSGKVQPKAKAVKKEKFANQFRNFSTRRYNRLRERRLRLGMQNGITSDVRSQKSRSERPDFEFSAEYKYGDITTTNMRSLGRASPSNRTNGGAELFGGIGTGTVRSVRSVDGAIELVPPADRIPDSEPSAYGPEGESKKLEFPNPESEEDEAVVERVLEAVREAEESFSRPVVEDEPDEKAVPVEDLASLHVDPAYKDQRYLKKAKEKKVVVTKSQAEIFDYLVGCWTTAQGTNQRRSNININVNVNESAPSSPKITSRHPGAHLAHDASDSSLLTLNRTETNSTVPFERNASLYGVQRTDTGSTLPNLGLERNASLLTVQRTDTGSTIPVQRSDTLDSQAPVVRTDTNETVSSYESGYQLFPPSSPKPSPMVPLARLGPQTVHSQSMKHLSNPPTGSGTLTVPGSIAPPAIVISPARDDRVLLHPNYAPPSPQHSRPQSPFDFNTNSAQVTSNAVSIESGGPMLAPPSHAQKFLLKQGSSRSPNRSPNQTVRLKPNAKAASLANLNPNHPPETGVLGSRQQLRQTLPSQEALQKISRLLAAPAPDHNGNSVSEMSVTVSVSEAATEHTGGGELFFPPPVGIDSHTAEHSSNTPERSGLGGETTNETGDVWEDENLEPPASPPMGSVSHSAATDATGATWGAGSRAARMYNRAARQAAESGERLPARNALMAEKSPEHSLLSGMTNRDPFAAYTHQFVRYPGIGRQVWLFTKRTWLQEFRSLRVFTLELALFIVGGLLNGLSYVDNFDFLPPLPLDFVAFCPPLIRNACATLPIKGDLFNMIGVTCTMSGLIAATSATRHFAGQMELYNFFREQEAGASPLAYFLGKMLALLPHSFIHAFFYLLGFYALAAPAADFWDFFVLLFLFFLISESIGFVTTTWIASEEAAILVSGVSACVAGLGAPKDDFSKEFCWSSYFGEALFGTAVRPDAFSPEINQVTRQYADFAFGYNLDHYARNCLILLAFLVVLRSISFVGLKYRVYQRQH